VKIALPIYSTSYVFPPGTNRWVVRHHKGCNHHIRLTQGALPVNFDFPLQSVPTTLPMMAPTMQHRSTTHIPIFQNERGKNLIEEIHQSV
jgi:hypothetical protein